VGTTGTGIRGLDGKSSAKSSFRDPGLGSHINDICRVTPDLYAAAVGHDRESSFLNPEAYRPDPRPHARPPLARRASSSTPQRRAMVRCSENTVACVQFPVADLEFRIASPQSHELCKTCGTRANCGSGRRRRTRVFILRWMPGTFRTRFPRKVSLGDRRGEGPAVRPNDEASFVRNGTTGSRSRQE